MTDFSEMRVRDLQRHLLKLGIDEAKVMGILDKKEMIELAEMYANHADQMAKITIIVIISLCISVLLLLWYYRSSILYVIGQICEWLRGYFYPIVSRIETIHKCVRLKLFIPIFLFQICLMLDLYELWIQLSVLLSWVVSHTSILRQYFPPVLSLHVSPHSMLKNMNMASNNSFLSGYGINLGSMITLAIIKYIRSSIENRAAKHILRFNKNA
jgi:hypothetical protein